MDEVAFVVAHLPLLQVAAWFGGWAVAMLTTLVVGQVV